MAGTIVVDRIESDSSYTSTINVASKVNFTSGMQIGGQDTTFGGMRNRIINGAMTIDQRNAGANTLPTNSYTLDRWNGLSYVGSSPSAKFTVARNLGNVTPPSGFTNYLGITVSTAYTSWASGDFFNMVHFVEGYNIADFDWGKTTAKSVTLSFWVRGSVVGNYSVALRNSDSNRAYATTYTINVANTWEYKTITIPGETTGTWLTDNNRGVELNFDLGRHSSYETSSPNTWNTAGSIRVAGTVRLLDTQGANLYITGVQLEKGSAASAFEYRQYGQELELCQRYCQTVLNGGETAGHGFVNGSSNAFIFHQGPVALRAAPSVSYTTTMYATNFSSNLATITGIGGVGFATNSNVVRIVFTLNSSPSSQACGINPNGSLLLLLSEL